MRSRNGRILINRSIFNFENCDLEFICNLRKNGVNSEFYDIIFFRPVNEFAFPQIAKSSKLKAVRMLSALNLPSANYTFNFQQFAENKFSKLLISNLLT